MSSSINLNLTGVGEEIAVAVAEAMRKQQATFQSQTAATIGKVIGKQVGKEIAGQVAQEVSEQVAAALETTLLEVRKPIFDVREQILANVNFMLACCQGNQVRFDKGVTVVLLKNEEQNFMYACVVSKVAPVGGSPLPSIVQGPSAWSDTEALLGLLEETKRALTRALELRQSEYGFYDIGDATKKR